MGRTKQALRHISRPAPVRVGLLGRKSRFIMTLKNFSAHSPRAAPFSAVAIEFRDTLEEVGRGPVHEFALVIPQVIAGFKDLDGVIRESLAIQAVFSRALVAMNSTPLFWNAINYR